MQIHEIRQLVQCIGVIVLIHREICLVGILSHLAIMVQMKRYHQAVSHLLPGFGSHDPCRDLAGGALPGVALEGSAGGEKQQGRSWVSLWNLTFRFGHLL